MKTALAFTLMTVMAITAYPQQYDSENDFETKLINDNKEVAITKYIGRNETVKIPPSIDKLPVTKIDVWAFAGSGLTSVTIPNSVTSIEEGAFIGCTKLASITIPNSVTSIGGWAFSETMITSITIPGSVTKIVNGAFLGCTNLTAINVAADNRIYSSIDGVLFSRSKTVLLQFPVGKTGSYTIPKGVTKIEDGAFRLSSISGVTIPNSVSSIGTDAFQASGNLTGITIPNSIIIIMNNTFDSCFNLVNVTIPDSVTRIEEHAFQACEHLVDITIPASVNSIEDSAFSDCTGLTSVTFQGVITPSGFDGNAFYGLGDLRERYLAGGPGKYTRPNRGNRWTKQ